jgi:hypothetical protein
MQFFDFNVANNKTQDIGALGRYVYYVSGTGGDTLIKITRTGSGDAVYLKPGQSWRIDDADKASDKWFISNYSNAGTVTGTVLIGMGEFRDDSQLVQLTGTPNVTVTNYPSALKLDYSGTWIANSAQTIGTPEAVFAAAANTNGAVLIDGMFTVGAGGGLSTFVCKATAPASATDGDVLLAGATAAGVYRINNPIVIPAGKGLYQYPATSSANLRHAVYKLL